MELSLSGFRSVLFNEFIINNIISISIPQVYTNKHNLFFTDHEHPQYHYFGCLYEIDPQSKMGSVFIPYRIRSLSLSPPITTCQNNGQKYTFEQSKLNNITCNNLYEWNVPIDIIDEYGKYLNYNSTSSLSYCNCTREWFGQFCQYSFQDDWDEPFTDIIDRRFFERYNIENDVPIHKDLTCYMGLKCVGQRLCLDWRQICNSIVDCDNGEDELDCLQLEINECDNKTEYRCKSGMCIEKTFAFDLKKDCQDDSDEEIKESYDNCHSGTSVDCEERNCAWMSNSCGDGTCNEECENRRDTYYEESLFNSNKNLSDEDNHTIFCRSCLIYQFDKRKPISSSGNTKCHKQCNLCENIFLYPAPFMHPSVNFLYKSTEDQFPSYLCYNVSQCQIFSSFKISFHNNRTCQQISHFF
ncbi:unnamed protein product [Didymodactylos carnosus]|uniref:EGF-like domain-containing protein n=1 Tax=Didymodactylos carnosus TaxID=1234261 RepID=A0A814RUV0_9BILA|nr:unnamed protein product [Didymodactylos carnosus]CAF3901428.1 unnamed protein product [Didymodactylos carnosus]